MGFAIDNLLQLFIGLQGESNARMIDIDMSEWMRDWPDAKVDVLVQRPGEDKTYPAKTKLRGGHLLWTPKREDVLIAGMGKAQIILTDKNDVELRSRVVQTIIGESIAGTEGEAPDPEQGWVHQVLQAANEVKAQVDVGTGTGLYLVNQRKDDQGKADRTAEDIKAAVSAGKTVLLRAVSGELYSLCVNLGPNLYFTNVRPGLPENLNSYGLTVKTAIMTEGDSIRFVTPSRGTLSPSPYKLKLTGAVEAEYDGSEEIVVEIPKTAAPEKEVVILPETYLTNPGGAWLLLNPWENEIVSGQVYTITYNGTPYECKANPVTENGRTFHALGNLALADLPGGNPNTPFCLIAIPNAQVETGGFYGMFLATDNPDSVTLSVVGSRTSEGTPPVQYTITINQDGSVTTDLDSEKLSSMTDAQIQASVTVLEDNGKGYIYTSGVDLVTRMVVADAGIEWVQLRIGKIVDFGSGYVNSAIARYIDFMPDAVPSLSTRWTESMPHMTHWDKGVAYMRYNGRTWEPVGIDQLKADLGLTGGETTTEDVFYTADGQVFTDVNGAVLHVQKGEA